MIAMWMIYVLIITSLLFAMGILGERIAELYRLPRRWVWMACAVAVIVGTVAVPFRASVVAPNPQVESTVNPVVEGVGAPAQNRVLRETAPLRTGLFEPVRTTAHDIRQQTTSLDIPLFALWATGSLLGIVTIIVGQVILARRRRSWRESTLCAVPVLVAQNDGPAIIGVVRPRIVVPEWSLDVDSRSQALIIAHEEEHINAGDPLLMRLSATIAVLMPWNLPLWGIARHLRVAVELDCDKRLLRRASADAPTYAELLFAVARMRGHNSGALVPALLQPRSSLRKRIKAMSPQQIRFRGLQLVMIGSVLGALLWVAAQTPAPRLEAQRTQVALPSNVTRLVGTLASAPPPPTTADEARPIIRRFLPRLLEWTIARPLAEAQPFISGIAFLRTADGKVIDTLDLRIVAELGAAAKSSRSTDKTAFALSGLGSVPEATARLQQARQEETEARKSVAMLAYDARERLTRALGQVALAEKILADEKRAASLGISAKEREAAQHDAMRDLISFQRYRPTRDAVTNVGVEQFEKLWRAAMTNDSKPIRGKDRDRWVVYVTDPPPMSAAATGLMQQVAAIDQVIYPAGTLWERPVTIYYVTKKP